MADSLVDWDAMAAFAGQHLLAPAIWPSLAEKNLASPMPDAMRQFLRSREAPGRKNYLLALEDIYLVNAARNAKIRAQALRIIAVLNAAGVEPAVLKGTRLLLGGDTPFRRARCLRDIDMVVTASDWERACAALQAAGYHGGGATLHAASFLGSGDNVEIDLHRKPLSLHAPTELPDYLTQEGFWAHTISIARPNARWRQLPASESLIHSILHTEVADLNFAAGDWPLRYLYETAAVTRDSSASLDWSVLNGLASDDLALPVRAHLHAAKSLFDAALPDSFVNSWRLDRHFHRCQANTRYPRSFRRVNILVHKLRQAVSPWYLARKGLYHGQTDHRGARWGLWHARRRSLADLARRYGRRLPQLLFGSGRGLPPPRV